MRSRCCSESTIVCKRWQETCSTSSSGSSLAMQVTTPELQSPMQQRWRHQSYRAPCNSGDDTGFTEHYATAVTTPELQNTMQHRCLHHSCRVPCNTGDDTRVIEHHATPVTTPELQSTMQHRWRHQSYRAPCNTRCNSCNSTPTGHHHLLTVNYLIKL